MSYEVFISYSRAGAGPHARSLAAALERSRPGAVFLDTREISPGAPFPDELAAAVAASRVVVVFAEPAYFGRPWCVRELEAALEPGGHGRTVLVVLPAETDADALLLHFPPGLARRAWPNAHQTEAIVNMVERALGGALERDLVLPTDSPLRPEGLTPPRSWNAAQRVAIETAPETLGSRLVGRDATLWTLFRALETRRAGGPGRSVLLCGGAGSGKSQLAAEYVHRAGPRFYDVACWLDADVTPEDWSRQLDVALSMLKTDPGTGTVEKRLAIACRDLDQSGQRILWVVDNVPEPRAGEAAKPLKHWCPAVGRVTLLATSRCPQMHGCDEAIALEVLAPNEAVQLLTQPKVDSRWLPDADWRAIARWVGGLPLALRILQAGLADESLSPSALRSAVDADEAATVLDDELELLGETLPPGALRGVSQALGASFDALARQPGARAALVALAQLRPWPLPEGLMDLVAEPQDRAVLVRRGWLQSTTAEKGARTWRIHRIYASLVRSRATPFEGEQALLERLFRAIHEGRIDVLTARELGKHLMQIGGPMVERINAAPEFPHALITAAQQFSVAAAFTRLADRAWSGFRYVGAGWARMFGGAPAVAARAQELVTRGDATETAALPNALQTLGADPNVCNLIVTLLSDARNDVRWQAIVHADAYAAGHVLVPLWKALVAETNDAVRKNGAPGLARLIAAEDAPLRALLSHIAPSLRARQPEIRALAAAAVGDAISVLGEDGAAGGFSARGLRQTLANLSSEETDPEVMHAIGRAIGVRHNAASWRTLADRYESAGDAVAAAGSLEALVAYLTAIERPPRRSGSARYIINDEDGKASLEIDLDGSGTPEPALWEPIVQRAVLNDGRGDDLALAVLKPNTGGWKALGSTVEKLLYEKADPAAVVTLAERCMKLLPHDMTPHWWRGMAREEAGDPEGALADFEIVTVREPRWGYAFKRISRLRLASGERDAARVALVQAQALIPDDPELAELAAKLG